MKNPKIGQNLKTIIVSLIKKSEIRTKFQRDNDILNIQYHTIQ